MRHVGGVCVPVLFNEPIAANTRVSMMQKEKKPHVLFLDIGVSSTRVFHCNVFVLVMDCEAERQKCQGTQTDLQQQTD